MPIKHKILPDYKTAYFHAWGEVNVNMILTAGEKMFAEIAWKNGYAVLCDYREISKFDVDSSDVEKVAEQDRRHKPLIDRSKCAIVAKSKLVFGLARMWELVSHDTGIISRVFEDFNEAINWLDLDPEFLSAVKKLVSTG